MRESKSIRLLKIRDCLEKGGKTREEIKNLFKVSEKTIIRDLEEMHSHKFIKKIKDKYVLFNWTDFEDFLNDIYDDKDLYLDNGMKLFSIKNIEKNPKLIGEDVYSKELHSYRKVIYTRMKNQRMRTSDIHDMIRKFGFLDYFDEFDENKFNKAKRFFKEKRIIVY